MSIAEFIALANSTALGLAIWGNGPVPSPAVRGASVVIMYAVAMSVALYAAARASARAAAVVGLVGTAAGTVICVPYVVRTGFSATGLVAISTLSSALATLSLGTIRTFASHTTTRQSGISGMTVASGTITS